MSERAVASGASIEGTRWYPAALALARIVTGGFWTCNVYFTLNLSFVGSLAHLQARSSGSQTYLLSFWTTWWLAIAASHTQGFALTLLLVEGGIALCLLIGVCTNLVCGLGMVFMLFAWSTHDLPLIPLGLYGALSGDGGLPVVCALVLLGLLLSNAGSYYGIDHFLAQRWGRWRWLTSHLPPTRSDTAGGYVDTISGQHAASESSQRPQEQRESRNLVPR